MAISYRKRFNGQSQEIIDHARKFGLWNALETFAHGGDYICFKKFLVEASGDPNIGSRPQVTDSAPEKLADYIVDSLLNRLRAAEKRIELLQNELMAERLNTQTRRQELKLSAVELLREVG